MKLYKKFRANNFGHTRTTLSYVYTRRLIGPISYPGAGYILCKKVTKCIREKMTMYFRVGEPLNHIHQNTKSENM